MSEPVTSSLSMNALIIVSEVAVVFAVVLAVVFFFEFKKRKKAKKLAVEFLQNLKNSTEEREKTINKKIDESTSLDDSEKTKIISTLVDAEKLAYLHIAQLFMGYKPDSILELEEELKIISENYFSIIDKMAQNAGGGENGDADAATRELKKQVSQLREEKKLLKEKNFQLQADFDASMGTIESMTTEFANMYEGGSKDGEKKIKNEMYQLRQTLAQKKEYTEVDDDEQAEVSASDDTNADSVDDTNADSVPDMTSSEDDAAK